MGGLEGNGAARNATCEFLVRIGILIIKVNWQSFTIWGKEGFVFRFVYRG